MWADAPPRGRRLAHRSVPAWHQRSYADLRSERGGHFRAAETPEQFAERLASFFVERAQL